MTVADDFDFWNKPESRRVAQEIDFIVMHTLPNWNGQLLKDALAWTQETLPAGRYPMSGTATGVSR